MRLLPALLLFALLVPSAVGQVLSPDVSQEARSAYENARLYLEMREVTRVGVVQSNGLAIPYSSTSRKWHGYQGFDRISEVAFFEAAGRDDLAERARTHRSNATTLTVVGSIASLIGFGLVTYEIVASESLSTDPFASDEGYNVPVLVLGSALAIGGSIPASIGMSRLRTNSVHAGIAAEAADTYNRALVDRLMETTPEPPIFSDTRP